MTLWKSQSKKFQVKVNGMRLEGLKIEPKDRVVIGIEMKWEGQGVPKSGFSPFNRKSQKITTTTSTSNDIKLLKLDEFEFDDDCDEFVTVCSFSIVSKDPISFAPWLVSFNILSGKIEESSTSSYSPTRETMQEIGKVGLNLGELASKMESQIEQKFPVVLQVNGVAMEVILRVVVGFVEMKNSSHSRSTSQDVSGLSPHDSLILLRRTTSQGPSLGREKAKKNKIRFFGKQWGSRNTEESSPTVSSESEDMAVASTSKISDTQSDLVKKNEFWKFNRRKSKKNKVESLETKLETTDQKIRPKSGSWESRELVCRDGKTKLKANVFLASYDQRDEQAAGESACAAIVAVIAHWLQSNPGKMPTGPDLDRLITEGSTEWRNLCDFPNQHFDLETILKANLRPLSVLPDHSRCGFFHPEEFEHLQDALSFDDIWDEINNTTDQHESRVYIIRWNEHFFVLKVDKDANYVVDSLGERLYEGCNQAYILKFDDSTVMYQKDDNHDKEGMMKKDEEKGQEKVICQGKDCCREYMRRFLAAIPLRELKEQNEQGKTMNVSALCQRLMIDFHLSSPSTSPADSSADSTANTSPTNCLV